MIKLNLNIGRTYDGFGEQVVKKETICLTNEEAAMYLTQFIEAMGVNKTKEWLKKAKNSDPELN